MSLSVGIARISRRTPLPSAGAVQPTYKLLLGGAGGRSISPRVASMPSDASALTPNSRSTTCPFWSITRIAADQSDAIAKDAIDTMTTNVKAIFRIAQAVRIAVLWDGACEANGTLGRWQSRHGIR